ncbi:hypothetical protein GQ42DRAFT_161481 [Ramicandelaber brevisporus]|nr:hypothetical protein GQ42DRAFT_161481 [Ramicandelaber brevisporus]
MRRETATFLFLFLVVLCIFSRAFYVLAFVLVAAIAFSIGYEERGIRSGLEFNS